MKKDGVLKTIAHEIYYSNKNDNLKEDYYDIANNIENDVHFEHTT